MMTMAACEGTKRRRRPGVRPRESREGVGVWTRAEHERFLQAERLFPKGPWKLVAQYIGTRSTRQTMTHAQKHRQKLQRRRRGLRRRRRDAASDAAGADSPAQSPVASSNSSGASPAQSPVASSNSSAASPAQSPVSSPLAPILDPDDLFVACGGVLRFQDLLMLPTDENSQCLPPLTPPPWEEPLRTSDQLGLEDALDFIIRCV